MTAVVKNTHEYHSAKFTGDTDLNNLRVGGTYSVLAAAHAPTATAYFVEVLPASNDGVIVQVATDKSDGSKSTRLFDGSAWGSWSNVGPAASIDARTSGASPITLNAGIFRHDITTGGTAGAESVVLPSGQYVGQRIEVVLAVRTNGSDSVEVDHTNLAAQSVVGDTAEDTTITAATLTAVGKYILFEWTGVKWNILYTNGTVTLT